MGLPFTNNAEAVLKIAADESKKLKHYYIGSEHILLGMLKEQSGLAGVILRRNNIDIDAVYDLISDLTMGPGTTALKERAGYSPRTLNLLDDASALAAKYHSGTVGTEHILLAILREGGNCALQILLALRKNPTEMYIQTLMSMGEDPQGAKEDLKKNKQKKKDNFLESYSKDLTALAKGGKLDPVIGRNDEITRVIQILSRRTKNNPCLVGEPGVGKTAIVEGLALRIAAGDVPDTVKNKRVLTLDLSGMVAGTKYRGEFEERMKRRLSEVTEAGDIILFLDELANYFSTTEILYIEWEMKTDNYTEEQLKGRGQYGKSWSSLKGQNLLVSLAVAKEDVRAPKLVSLLCGLALADILRPAGMPALLAWPIDVVAGDA